MGGEVSETTVAPPPKVPFSASKLVNGVVAPTVAQARFCTLKSITAMATTRESLVFIPGQLLALSN